MTLKHIKCNIFFTIGCLSLTLLLGCRTEQNTESKIETTSSEKSPIKKFNPNTQNNITLEIDDAALVELDQWTSFFILQKERLKAKTFEPTYSDYVVQPGDNLWSIAGKQYGDSKSWIILLWDNEDSIKSTSGILSPGMVLKLREKLDPNS